MSLPRVALKLHCRKGITGFGTSRVHADLGLVFLSLSLSFLLCGMAQSCQPLGVEQCCGPGREQVLWCEQGKVWVFWETRRLSERLPSPCD